MTIHFQKNLIKFCFSLIFLVIFSPAVLAQKMHGLAMHGLPKYKNDFTHLDYVNPNAPKGGALRYGVYGSYDNLNRIAFKGR